MGSFKGPKGNDGQPGAPGEPGPPGPNTVPTQLAVATALFPEQQSITYNPVGDVTSVTENGITTTYAYNEDGSIQSDTRLGVTRDYVYDGDGNLTGIEAQ